MTQLILDVNGAGIILPESIKGGYRAYQEDLGVTVDMISGRMVKELRGRVWRVSYQYGWFSDEEKKKVLAACEKGRSAPILCQFLPPEESGGELVNGEFFVVGLNYPRFFWSRDGKPLWGDFSLELREVRPHD